MATDLQMLRAILSLPAVKFRKKGPFQAMYDDLQNGKMVHLSKKQRAWVQDIFLEYKLDRTELPPRDPPRKDRNVPVALDFGPLPKRPPGKSRGS